MKAIILAAGQGLRLAPLTSERPKCLLRVGGLMILERQLSVLRKRGIDDIYVVIGTKGQCWNQSSFEIIKNLSRKIVFNFDNDKNHSPYSMYLALNQSKQDNALLVDGDMVFTEKFLDEVLLAPLSNFMVTKLVESRMEVGTRIEIDRKQRIVNLGKLFIPAHFPWDLYSGFMKVSEESFSNFRNCLGKKEYFSKEIEYPIKDFCDKDTMYVLRVQSDEWVNVNTTEDLEKAESLFS